MLIFIWMDHNRRHGNNGHRMPVHHHCNIGSSFYCFDFRDSGCGLSVYPCQKEEKEAHPTRALAAPTSATDSNKGPTMEVEAGRTSAANNQDCSAGTSCKGINTIFGQTNPADNQNGACSPERSQKPGTSRKGISTISGNVGVCLVFCS